MVKATCNNVLWELYIGLSGQGGAPTGPSPLLKINKSPTLYIYICIYLVCTLKIIVCVCISSGVQCALVGVMCSQLMDLWRIS